MKKVKLFVMADTTYGNCCVDEVGAAHANADCVIHYGHACLSPSVDNFLSPFVFLGESCNSCNLNFSKNWCFLCFRTSTLPAFFVFGKASINVPSCVEKLCGYALKNENPVLVKLMHFLYFLLTLDCGISR